MIPDELRVVITGAGQGIGRALARHFLAKGHRVFLIDINEEELKYTANEHLKKFTRPGRVGWKVCDLGDPEQIRSAIEEAAKLFDNQIDALINNGGISCEWPLLLTVISLTSQHPIGLTGKRWKTSQPSTSGTSICTSTSQRRSSSLRRVSHT